jgi:hypothetical protein
MTPWETREERRGPLHARRPEGRGSKTAAGYGISLVSSSRAAAGRISTDRTLVRKEGAWQETFI